MRVCPFCGEEIPEDAKVCPACNEAVDTPKKIHCPYCNEEIEENVEICPACGETIKKKTAVPMKIPKRLSITLGIVLGVVLILGAGFFGFREREISSYKTAIQVHGDTDPYDSTVSTLEALNKMAEEEKALTAYLNSSHLKSSKEKVFYNFLINAEYYTKVFSYQNQRKCDWGDSDIRLACISAVNRMLRFGRKANIDGVEVAPVYGELTPPNSRFGNLKITSPEVPFVKLVFNPNYCSDGYYLNDGIGYVSICNGSSYYYAEPNYKYIKETYSKYLDTVWQEYFDIKIKQQEDLRNSAFSNGNGGSAPSYINKEVAEWSDALVKLLAKYPNFIMYDDVARQILHINYPGYESLLSGIKKETKLYKMVKEALDSLNSEYMD